MKKENLLVAAIVIIGFASVFIYNDIKSGMPLDESNAKGSSQSGSVIDWQDFETGLELAKENKKHIFLYFHAPWCTYCVKLKKTTFRDKDVAGLLKKSFISISVDTDRNKKLADRWNIKGLPSLWFLSPEGEKLTNIPGYVDADIFLKVLDYIETGKYKDMDINEFMAKG